MAARRRRRTYKFTEKRQSKLGIAALMLAIFSIFIFGLVVANSFMHVSSMLLAVIAFVMAIRSLMDENVFKLFPYLSTIVSFLAAGGWIMLYVIGF
jgi:predicted neutral ceramidase superfamily lipid hydrolase